MLTMGSTLALLKRCVYGAASNRYAVSPLQLSFTVGLGCRIIKRIFTFACILVALTKLRGMNKIFCKDDPPQGLY